jgi:hypothetical protein
LVADIVNLRRARKAHERVAKAAAADQNRITFGTSTAEKRKARQQTEREAHQLDGARRIRGEPETETGSDCAPSAGPCTSGIQPD